MAKGAEHRIGRPKGTGSQRVYDDLRARILRLELAPGEHLDENALVRAYGVSRTPVREALIRLRSEGLVNLLPNRGARVVSLDVHDIPQMFEAIELCMRVTVRWATARRSEADLAELRELNRAFAEAAAVDDFPAMSEANKAFHVAIARASGNRYLVQLSEGLFSESLRLSYAALAFAPINSKAYKEYFSHIVDEHQRMIAAIAGQDVEAADQVARAHAHRFRNRFLRYLEKSLAGDTPLEAPPARGAAPV